MKQYYQNWCFKTKLDKIVPPHLVQEGIEERMRQGKEPFDLNYDSYSENKLPKYFLSYKIDQLKAGHGEGSKTELEELDTPLIGTNLKRESSIKSAKDIDFSKVSLKKLSRLLTSRIP